MSPITPIPPRAPLVERIGRSWHSAAGPINLAMLAWLYYGRALAGAPIGWISLGMLAAGIPLLVIPMLWLSWRGYRYRRVSQTVTPTQAFLHVLLWCAMFVCGATIVDVTDEPGAASALTQWFGAHLADQSWMLAHASAVAIYLAMGCLGLAQWLERDPAPEGVASKPNASRKGADGIDAQSTGSSPPPPPLRPYVPPVTSPRQVRRGASVYRHMGWLSAAVLLWTGTALPWGPFITAILVVPSLAVVLAGYRFGRDGRRLTVPQYRRVVAVLAALTCCGGTVFAVPRLGPWASPRFGPLLNFLFAVAWLCAVRASFGLAAAYRRAPGYVVDARSGEHSATERVLPEHQRT